jgi:hypothetical protein
MPSYSCPKGHASTESDFCSECGARINGAPESPPVSPVNKVGLADCPECAAPRMSDHSNFCEVCGYNFLTSTPGEAPPPVTPAVAPPPPAVPPAPEPPAAPPVVDVAPAVPVVAAPPPVWTLFVTVDPTLREEGSPEPPQGVGPFTIKLEKAVNLIGRKSESRGVFPEVPLNFDDAVSHRHALLNCQPDGTLVFRDIGSSNGTRRNGKDLPPLTDQPIEDGDRLELGHWTRIEVKAVR